MLKQWAVEVDYRLAELGYELVIMVSIPATSKKVKENPGRSLCAQ